jgi:hypothetical protein
LAARTVTFKEGLAWQSATKMADMRDTTFERRFEAWRLSHGEQALQLRNSLNGTYAEAWASGNTTERILVLEFIYDTRHSAGYGLVLEGLVDSNRDVAEQAACVALGLITHNEKLEGDILGRLQAFEQSWPSSASVAYLARQLLGGKQTR